MATSEHPLEPQVLELIGAIVLSTQDAERYLKVILPFCKAEDPSITGALVRHDKLQRRPLGELVGKFVDSFTVESPEFERHLADLVERRNQIVHHFTETYGEQMRSGKSKQVIESLRVLLGNVNGFRNALQQTALHLFEAIRDTSFINTPEYEDMNDACASLRRQIAN